MGRQRTGHIRQRDGKYLVELAGEYFGTFDTSADAERRLKTVLESDADNAPDAFSVFASEWMDAREVAAIERKRHLAIKKERSVWRAHVSTAHFFDWPIKRLQQPKEIQKWLRALANKTALSPVRQGKDGVVYRKTTRKLGRRVQENALKLLKLCLDDAIIDGRLSAPNPARLVKLPREEVPSSDGQLIVHLTKAEIKALFALDLPALQRAVFSVAIYAGLRLDELWGLRWQELTLDGKRPEVRVRYSYASPCKTKDSRRNVPLLPPAVAALKAWRAAQDTVPIGGLVFPSASGGCHSESYTAGWRDKKSRFGTQLGWASKAGIRAEVTFHALRHTCGCHLAQGTWAPEMKLGKIRLWLGHSSITVTERHYAAFTSDNLHNAVAFSGDLADDQIDHT